MRIGAAARVAAGRPLDAQAWPESGLARSVLATGADAALVHAALSSQVGSRLRCHGGAMAAIPMCSRILRTGAGSVIADISRNRPWHMAHARTSISYVRRSNVAQSMRGEVASKRPPSSRSRWRTEMPCGVTATSPGEIQAALGGGGARSSAGVDPTGRSALGSVSAGAFGRAGKSRFGVSRAGLLRGIGSASGRGYGTFPAAPLAPPAPSGFWLPSSRGAWRAGSDISPRRQCIHRGARTAVPAQKLTEHSTVRAARGPHHPRPRCAPRPAD